MEFSALMYEVSLEMKNLEKKLQTDGESTNGEIISAIQILEQAKYKLEMKSKAIELSKKKFSKDINKEKNEKLFYE